MPSSPGGCRCRREDGFFEEDPSTCVPCHNLCKRCQGRERTSCQECYSHKHSLLQKGTSTCICEDRFFYQDGQCPRTHEY